jgi:hypothetical protein
LAGQLLAFPVSLYLAQEYLAQEMHVVEMHAVAMHVAGVSWGGNADSQHQTRYDISL